MVISILHIVEMHNVISRLTYQTKICPNVSNNTEEVENIWMLQHPPYCELVCKALTLVVDVS